MHVQRLQQAQVDLRVCESSACAAQRLRGGELPIAAPARAQTRLGWEGGKSSISMPIARGGGGGGGACMTVPARALERWRDCTALCQAGVLSTAPDKSSSLLLDMIG